MLKEELVILFGVIESAKENWSAHLVLILLEGIYDWSELIVYLSIKIKTLNLTRKGRIIDLQSTWQPHHKVSDFSLQAL